MTCMPPLFAVDSSVGCGARQPPIFRTGRELLTHMDRLGVARTLVWNIPARDVHPYPANQRLLRDIRRLDPRGQRLIPVQVISSPMWMDRNTADEAVALVRTGQVRALQLFPATCRFHLHHAEPFLARVAPWKPVILIDVNEVNDDRPIGAMAAAFPELNFICLHGMWPHFYNFSLLDLLQRHANIMVDTSGMHNRGILEKIVRDFGPTRAVFGLPHATSNGASIAQLARVDIGDADRAMIANGTLSRLLNIEPPRTSMSSAPARIGKNWAALVTGRTPPTPAIDAHGHIGLIGHWPQEERSIIEQVDLLVRSMDALNITTMIVSGSDALFSDPVAGNRRLEQVVASRTSRIKGYLAFNPVHADALIPALNRFFRRPFFVGFKTLCDYWNIPVTDPRFEPMLRYADRHRLPILYHTWDTCFDSPAMLTDIVARYPNAFFLLGHSGGGDRGRHEAEELARKSPNVYLEWCGSFCSTVPWEDTLAKVGFDKVVFGTDGIFHDQAWELGRLLSLKLPESALQPILAANFRKILSMRRKPGHGKNNLT